jgi:hypothetical protein
MESEITPPEIEKTHVHIDLDNYYVSQKHRGFSEFNIIINGKNHKFTAEEVSKFLEYIKGK